MAVKEQFMVGVDKPIRDRLDALRIVMGVSRAEVNRQALERGGLDGLERAYAERLGRLFHVAAAGGQKWDVYVRTLLLKPEYRQSAPTLEDLEQGHARA